MWNFLKHKIFGNKAVIALLVLTAADVALWFFALTSPRLVSPQFYFLNVGQGDSELVLLPKANGGSVKLLIDGGPDAKVVEELAKVLPVGDRRIDLVLMTHPQLDHFGGFIEALRQYEVGALLGTGRVGTTKAYRELMRVIRERQIPYITLRRGSRIAYGDTVIDVLSPNARDLASKELNDGCLVLRVATPAARALFTCDAGENVERELIASDDVRADILKVGHHGSRFSSSAAFLRAVSPRVAVIEVGKNSYGHPTKDALARLAASGTKIFRTDWNGTVRATAEDGVLRVFAERQ